ncbi:hypothetical protein CAPTEDRAFT_94722, partial [Capitella teleta]
TFLHRRVKLTSDLFLQWDLVCGNNYLAEMSQVIYQCVMIFGDLITSYAADKVGRKPIHIFAHALVVIFGSATGLSQSYISFVVLKAITGLASVSSRSTGLLLIMEMFGSEHRSVTGIGLEFQWVILYLLLPVLAFLLHNWRHLQVLLSLSSLLWMVYIWILPESPMWLVANGQYEKAELSLTKMAKRNGLRLNEPLLLSREKEKPNTDMQMTISEDGITATVQDVKVPQLKLIHFFDVISIDSFLRLANTGVYYGLILSTPSLAGDRFLNFAITGLVEIPANALALLAVHRFGRRIPTCVFHMIAGIPLGAVAFLPFRYKELTTALAMIAKFGISASFAVIVLYTRELFPTNLRYLESTSSAIITTLGGVGTVIAPFAAYATSLSWLPSITFAALSVICGLLSLVLPETAGRPMPQTLEDIHALYR